jgi:hypothetical protein
MALEVVALALWIPVGVTGLWFFVTGRRIFGLPKGLKEGSMLRVFGLIYFLVAGYVSYLAIHAGSFAADGLVLGYALVVALGLTVLNRWRKARRAEAVGPRA